MDKVVSSATVSGATKGTNLPDWGYEDLKVPDPRVSITELISCI